MAQQTESDTLDSLRVALHRLIQTPDPQWDPAALASFKRILILRIADLETEAAPARIHAEMALLPPLA